MSFGFSASELAKTLDNAALLIRKLKDAPKELDSIKNRLQFGQSFVTSLREQIVQHADTMSDSERGLLDTIYDEYAGALNNLEAFIKKHARLENKNLGARLIWVTSEHFSNEREGLSKSLEDVESKIHLVLQKLNWGASLEQRKLLRTNSISAPEQYLSQQYLSPGRYVESPRPDSARKDSGQSVTESTADTAPAGLGLLGPSHLSPYQTTNTDAILDTFEFGHPSPTSPTSPTQRFINGKSSDPIPITRPRAPTFSTSPKDLTHIPGSFSTISTKTPSVFDSGMSVSSQSEASTPRHSLTPTLPYQETSPRSRPCSQFTSPSLYSKSESTPNVSDRGRLDSRSTFSSASISLSPRKNAPPRFEEELSHTNGMLQGVVKLWFKIGSERVSRTVLRINIEGEQAGFTRTIRLMTDDGKMRTHEAGKPSLGLTKSFLQLHPQCIEHITKKDKAARFVVSFMGTHILCKEENGEMRPFFKGSPEYAFTNEQDCRTFQSSISCGKLQENVDTEKILSAGNMELSLWQVLQIWTANGETSIRFLKHDNEDYEGDNAVPILDIKTNTLYPIDLKKTPESELKLAFTKGADNAMLGKLKITFTKELEKEKEKKSRKKLGSKERTAAPEEESVKQRVLKLARFGTG